MQFAGTSGYQADATTGLLLLGHRYYDASIGRFLSSDPAQAGSNWYAYCDSNPLVRIDPTGLMPPVETGEGDDDPASVDDPDVYTSNSDGLYPYMGDGDAYDPPQKQKRHTGIGGNSGDQSPEQGQQNSTSNQQQNKQFMRAVRKVLGREPTPDEHGRAKGAAHDRQVRGKGGIRGALRWEDLLEAIEEEFMS